MPLPTHAGINRIVADRIRTAAMAPETQQAENRVAPARVKAVAPVVGRKAPKGALYDPHGLLI